MSSRQHSAPAARWNKVIMFALRILEITMFSQITADRLESLRGSLKFIGLMSRRERKLAVWTGTFLTFDVCQAGKITAILRVLFWVPDAACSILFSYNDCWCKIRWHLKEFPDMYLCAFLITGWGMWPKIHSILCQVTLAEYFTCHTGSLLSCLSLFVQLQDHLETVDIWSRQWAD